MVRRLPRFIAFVLLVILLLGSGKFIEAFISDSATRLAYQIRDEASALRRSHETKRTFVHRPKAWPDGLSGDYRIEIVSTPLNSPEHRSILTANSYDGPTRSGTSYHLNYVVVPQNLVVRPRQGEPTLVTLELNGDRISLTALP